jgi:(5-formylfuran-3-yl)methyl phosphate synthase
MQLLASVRTAAETAAALAGGADIIDAKEPNRGSLGAVSPRVLRQICERVPWERPVSIALGDVSTAAEVVQSIRTVPQVPRTATYLKFGFAGITNPELVHRCLRVALDSVAGRTIGIVAVAYADAGLAGSLAPEVVCGIAAEARATGVLFDTCVKGDRHLLTWLDPARLAVLLSKARAAGLLTAVAGGLGAEQLAGVRQAGPDIVGFRGALCLGGREGRLSEHRVRLFRQLVGPSEFGSSLPRLGQVEEAGETPGVSAILTRPR